MNPMTLTDAFVRLLDNAVCFGTRFRHYKGGMYIGICEAQHEGSGESMIVYQAEETKTLWIRPMSDFYSTVEHEGKIVDRFEPVSMAL